MLYSSTLPLNKRAYPLHTSYHHCMSMTHTLSVFRTAPPQYIEDVHSFRFYELDPVVDISRGIVRRNSWQLSRKWLAGDGIRDACLETASN